MNHTSLITYNSTYGLQANDFIQYVNIEDSKYICGVISTPTCNSPSKLSGLGDNISSTGFVYQKKILQVEDD